VDLVAQKAAVQQMRDGV